MRSDEYIFPSELLALLAFLFAPPLALGVAAQAWVLAVRGVFLQRPTRALAAVASTIVGSVVGGTAVFLASPSFLHATLGVHDVAIAGRHVVMAPMAFITVGVVAPFATWWALRARAPER